MLTDPASRWASLCFCSPVRLMPPPLIHQHHPFRAGCCVILHAFYTLVSTTFLLQTVYRQASGLSGHSVSPSTGIRGRLYKRKNKQTDLPQRRASSRSPGDVWVLRRESRLQFEPICFLWSPPEYRPLVVCIIPRGRPTPTLLGLLGQ